MLLVVGNNVLSFDILALINVHDLSSPVDEMRTAVSPDLPPVTSGTSGDELVTSSGGDNCESLVVSLALESLCDPIEVPDLLTSSVGDLQYDGVSGDHFSVSS